VLFVIWANKLGEKFKFTKEVYVGESTQFTQIGYVVHLVQLLYV